MELNPSKKVYTLYLNSELGFSGLLGTVSATNDANWNVDWDSLFNRDNYIYKNCNVRVRFVSAPLAGQPSELNLLGVLTANFGQNFTGKNVPGVVLGFFQSDLLSTFDGSYYNLNSPFLKVDTMTDALGQQIDMPYGLRTLNIQQWRNGYGVYGDAQNVLMPSASNFTILLQFELS